MREAPSIEVIHLLTSEGARIKAYDPVAMEVAKRFLPEITYCHDAYEVAKDSEALIVVTEWNEFQHLDMVRIKGLMRQPVLIDGRNIYDPRKVGQLGFIYRGVGRGYEEPAVASEVRVAKEAAS
jgi:UDPglucose 6-dehydrogenase